jgi:dipeptidase D
LNLDTEDWGEVFIGCAGGLTFDFDRDLDFEAANSANKTYKITLGGLSGGHSGVQIHEQLGNAIKLLSEALIQSRELDYQLVLFDGGTAHNVIPRDAHAVVVMNEAMKAEMQSIFDKAVARFKEYLPKVDEKLFITIEETEKADKALTTKARNLLFNCITMVPHGASTYNLVQPADLADLSSNCARVHCIDGHLKIITSMRYFNVNESVAMDQRHQALAETFDLTIKRSSGYPSWTPEFDNPMLDLAKSTYEELYGSVPELKAIHAGLECGILKGKKEDLEIVSFGPTIKGAHSPSERLKIDTVGPFWDLFVAMLAKL